VLQVRDGTRDASLPGAATMVVARSATGIGGPLGFDLGRPQYAVGRPERHREEAGSAGGEPHLNRVEQGSRTVSVLRPKGRPRGLNAEGGIVGGENANWVFE